MVSESIRMLLVFLFLMFVLSGTSEFFTPFIELFVPFSLASMMNV